MSRGNLTSAFDFQPATTMNPNPQCDPSEAPAGYMAVPKPAYSPETGNICRQCDWRKECQSHATDFTKRGHRCMSDAVVSSATGETLQRADQSSVIFKLKA